jgi:tRNA 5-methylaminomethyl-2-thiouridine biosynthesis bifunctional protein
VSGSVAFGAWPDAWNAPQVINGNGHFIGGVAAQSNLQKFWLSGATYERESYETPAELQIASLEANLNRLQKLLPTPQFQAIRSQFEAEQVHSWQGIRCTTSDRLPIVGALQEGLYVCTAMGSRGLSFAALCSAILAQEITSKAAQTIIPSTFRQLLMPQRKTLKVTSS